LAYLEKKIKKKKKTGQTGLAVVAAAPNGGLEVATATY
jgi:hypothetical protein